MDQINQTGKTGCLFGMNDRRAILVNAKVVLCSIYPFLLFMAVCILQIRRLTKEVTREGILNKSLQNFFRNLKKILAFSKIAW